MIDEGSGREPQQLPSGRHGLSREVVERSQRERLLEAMIGAVNENGYQATSIVEVAGRAGVSRKTFYELFGDKEGCFIAALDWLIERLMAFLGPAWQRPGAWSDRIRRSLAALLTALSYRPEGARLAMVETLVAGPRARERYRAALAALGTFVDQGRSQTPLGDELPEHISRIVAGGAAALIFEQISAGNASELRRLHPELVYLVLLPYLGHERAHEEMQRSRARHSGVGQA
jgi:AcrR family transcriptional regulator